MPLKPLFMVAAFAFLCLTAACFAAYYGDAYVSGSIADAVSLIPFLSTRKRRPRAAENLDISKSCILKAVTTRAPEMVS